MTSRNGLCVAILAISGALLGGCMPKFTVEELKNMTPERPVELDKLDMFAGEWESTSEGTMCVLDEVIRGTGSSKMEWTLDQRFLVEHSDFQMGELGEMKGLGLWTYDPKAKKYRMWWFDSYGGGMRGTATYSAETRTWKMKAKGNSPWGKSRAKGTITFVDDDNADWTWAERDGTGLFKTMEMTGSMKRK